jgi:hypothetical protein
MIPKHFDLFCRAGHIPLQLPARPGLGTVDKLI